jgi:hypothetical protein
VARQTVELTFQKDKLKQMREENAVLNGEVHLLKGKLSKQSSDADDILTHKQREISQKVERVTGLEARVKELEAVCRERDDEIKTLESERKESRKKLEQAAQLASEKGMLEEAVRRQDAVIARQDEEMERLKHLLQEMEEACGKTQMENEELFLKASGTTKLAVLFGQPWLLTRSRHRLHGDVPVDREENTLTNLGGKHIVLYGGVGRGGGGGDAGANATSRELAVVNLDTFTWEKVATQHKHATHGAWHSGHTGTAMAKNKMVVFGGRRGNAMTNEVHIFNTDSLKWITPAVKGTCSHREYHSSCALREKVYVMGGISEEGDLTSDLWLLDFDTMQWSMVSTYGQAAPRPRRGHAMCGSEKDRKIIVCGGFDGDAHLMDVCVLETDRLTWSCPSTTGMQPPPREGHAASMVGKYLFIAGECCTLRPQHTILISESQCPHPAPPHPRLCTLHLPHTLHPAGPTNTLHPLHTRYPAFCILHPKYCAPFTSCTLRPPCTPCTLHTLRPAPCTLHPELCNPGTPCALRAPVHSTPCTLHPAPPILRPIAHPAPCAPPAHPTPCTLHPARCTLQTKPQAPSPKPKTQSREP